MSPADRRRLAFATIVTLVALPALWLMQRDESTPGRPSVAAVGAPVPQGDDPAAATTEPVTPAYLEGPTTTAGPAAADPVVIATGTDPSQNRLSGTASFRRFDPTVFPAGVCQINAVPLSVTVTVRNVDNDRTTSCVNASTMKAEHGDIAVIDTALFLQIADLVDAPLPVELTW